MIVWYNSGVVCKFTSKKRSFEIFWKKLWAPRSWSSREIEIFQWKSGISLKSVKKTIFCCWLERVSAIFFGGSFLVGSPIGKMQGENPTDTRGKLAEKSQILPKRSQNRAKIIDGRRDSVFLGYFVDS